MNVCHQKASSENMTSELDVDLLLYMEYAFENIGFIPKWLSRLSATMMKD